MKCNNCGCEKNAPGQLRCVKCNAPLEGSIGAENRDNSNRKSETSDDVKKTVTENVSNNNFVKDTIYQCQKCGYPITANMAKCPNCYAQFNQFNTKKKENEADSFDEKQDVVKCSKCGAQFSNDANFCVKCGNRLKESVGGAKENTHNNRAGTIDPYANPQYKMPRCRIKPIRLADEPEFAEISFVGKTVSLNRDNTDPDNNTISSNAQAELIYEDNAWYINDKSSYNTTFVHVTGRMKLNDGDIILMGNRRFIFKDSTK